MVSATKELTSWPMLLGTLAVLASMGMVQSASFGGISSLSREMNFNSIPGGDNDDSNLVEPAPFASLSDFLSSKQGLGKKSDDTSRMKALVKALYALDALDKKMADKGDTPDILDEEAAIGAEDISESTTATPKTETTTAAAPSSTTPGRTTMMIPTTTDDFEPMGTHEPSTDAPTLVHDSEVNEFVDQIAKHISTFFSGIMHYFDSPSLPANATVVIELEEKTEDSSESSENGSESESKEDESSTEDVPQWLVKMFETVANLPQEESSQEEDKHRDFRPKESRESAESQEQ